MFTRIQLISKFINYYITSSNGRGHGIHSPFTYNFIRQVLLDKRKYPKFDEIEELRKNLLRDETIIEVEDFGAGSMVTKDKKRTVASIARNASKTRKYAQLLSRIAHHFKPTQILELGTSLGISTAYLASANADSRVISLEGSNDIAETARKNMESLGLQNVHIVTGNFDDTLIPTIKRLPQIDMVYFDGNHRKEPTIRYFLNCLPHITNDSFFIFDDIHWSEEMEEAWEEIKKHPSVRLSIDLFFIGLVFFRKEFREKQHFTIRF